MKRKERVFKLSLSLTERPSLAFYDASSFLIDGFIEMVSLSLCLYRNEISPNSSFSQKERATLREKIFHLSLSLFPFFKNDARNRTRGERERERMTTFFFARSDS